MKFYNIYIGSKLYRAILFIFLLVSLRNYACAEEPDSFTKNQFRIVIFREQGFPSSGTPVLLTPEWLHDNLSKNFSVTYLDISKLSDKKYLNLDNVDLLILPYGEAFPYKAFENIKEYIFDGGGILNVSGRPFWTPMDKRRGRWQKVDVKDPHAVFLSQLGIKYYESEETQGIGLSVTTSLGFSPVHPTHGNVFPYRIPARDFSKNKEGMVFVKSWRNPYIKTSNKIPNKWCLIGSRREENPLNPKKPDAQKNLMDAIEYLLFPIVIHGLETDFAGYYQGERVEVSLKIINGGKTAESGVIEIEFLDKESRVIYAIEKPVDLQPKAQAILKETWQPKRFESSFYTVRASLKKNGIILDREENGFVVIDKDILKNGLSIGIDKNRFIIKNKESLILGVNYYESKLGELMWLKPNLLKVREDFKAMRKLGLNFVRIHYHHSKWFRDYFSQIVKEPLDPYFQESDTEPLPSERSLRILDAIIQLAQEQGLIFCMDIFSLVPQEMGNPIGWLALKERIVDKDKLTRQKEFIRLIAQRYKDVPGITWDLWNEPRLEGSDLELLRSWVVILKDEFRKNQDTHLITVGDNLSLQLLDVLDYASVHTYKPEDFISLTGLSKPFIFQEIWNESGSSLDDELRQAERLEKQFKDFLKTASAGFVSWQWTRQARLWNNASLSERWDDELGLCVHDDGTLKVAGKTFSSLIEKLLNH